MFWWIYDFYVAWQFKKRNIYLQNWLLNLVAQKVLWMIEMLTLCRQCCKKICEWYVRSNTNVSHSAQQFTVSENPGKKGLCKPTCKNVIQASNQTWGLPISWKTVRQLSYFKSIAWNADTFCLKHWFIFLVNFLSQIFS